MKIFVVKTDQSQNFILQFLIYNQDGTDSTLK